MPGNPPLAVLLTVPPQVISASTRNPREAAAFLQAATAARRLDAALALFHACTQRVARLDIAWCKARAAAQAGPGGCRPPRHRMPLD
jgi:hypothetical protein